MIAKKHGFNSILSILALAGIMTLSLASTAAAQSVPAWDALYEGTGIMLFGVNGCGREKTGGSAVVNLWGSGNSPSGEEYENGTWGITLVDSSFPRLAGTISAVSGNGKNLYLDFYRAKDDSVTQRVSDYLQAYKGDLCEIDDPDADDIIWQQARAKTNKTGTAVKVKIRAKYPAIVTDSGHTKKANFRLDLQGETS